MHLDWILYLNFAKASLSEASATIRILKEWGAKRIKFVGLIAAPEGIAEVHKAHPEVPIHIASLDERLTGKRRSIPGRIYFPRARGMQVTGNLGREKRGNYFISNSLRLNN